MIGKVTCKVLKLRVKVFEKNGVPWEGWERTIMILGFIEGIL